MEIQCFCEPWWLHEMEAFSALLALCAGNSPVAGEFPAQRPVTRSFEVFFNLRLKKWLSKADDLRRHRAHYDVTVMVILPLLVWRDEGSFGTCVVAPLLKPGSRSRLVLDDRNTNSFWLTSM